MDSMDGMEIMMSVNKDEFWTKELELSLAEKIRGFPALYDNAHEDWKNKLHRDDIWEMIATEMDATVEQCKRKYKGLRDKLVREHRLGKQSNWPAAEVMNFVLPLARTRRENNNRKKTGFDDSSNTFVSVESGSYDDEDDGEEDAEAYYPTSSIISISTPRSIPSNKIPTIVDARSIPTSEHKGNSNKRKFDDVDDSSGSGDYYNQERNAGRLPPGPKSVIMNRLLNTTISSVENNSSNRKQQQYKNDHDSNGAATQNSNRNKNQNSSASSNSNNQGEGPNYHFGQYISSALDTLHEVAANETRQKLQELLFKAQLKQTCKSDIDSGRRRQSGVSPQHVVIFDENTGREQVLEIEKDTV